jgi:hypothetical protein
MAKKKQCWLLHTLMHKGGWKSGEVGGQYSSTFLTNLVIEIKM